MSNNREISSDMGVLRSALSSKLVYCKILVTVTHSVTNVPQTNNTSTSGMNEE